MLGSFKKRLLSLSFTKNNNNKNKNKNTPAALPAVARSHFLWEAAVRQLIMYMKIDDLVKLFEFSLGFQGPMLSDKLFQITWQEKR